MKGQKDFILCFHCHAIENKNANYCMQDIGKIVLLRFVKLCMKMPCWCPFKGYKYGHRKPTEISVFESFYKCMNSSLEELIKIKVIVILRQGMFR